MTTESPSDDAHKTAHKTTGGVTIGDVEGGIHGSTFAGRDVIQQITQIFTGPPDQQRSRRNQLVLLEKVKTFWVKGVLENSLHGAALIELEIEYKPDAIQYSWENILQRPNNPEEILPPGTKIGDVVNELNRELLILGAPASGKTTMLLELARDLIARAEQDESHPIPVVFNLSSWAEKRLPVDGWLVDELNVRYDVPRKVGKEWIATDQVLPLLDGLDEVKREYRATCVEAINAYRGQHGLAGLVVCSRVGDYESLVVRLKLQGAVLVQPLNPQQIDTYLASAGDRLAVLREVIQRDDGLRDLAASPLLLSLMTLAYQGVSVVGLTTISGIDEQRTHLFATYVERMFRRRGTDTRYTPQQTIHWLVWLAREMARQGQSIFFIEQLQPDYLTKRMQRWKYTMIDRLGLGLIMGLVVWLLTDAPTDQLVFGLLGMLVGALSGRKVQEKRLPTQGIWSALRSAMMGGLVGVLIVGPVSTLVYYWPLRPGALGLALPLVLIYGLVSALFFGLVGGPSARPRRITVVETLRWSWANAMRAALGGLAAGLAGGVIVGLVVGLGETVSNVLREVVGFGLAFGLVLGVGFGLRFGLAGGEVEAKVRTNQGIWRSARNAIVGGLVFGLGSALSLGLLNSLVYRKSIAQSIGLLLGPHSALVLFGGFLGALVYGGSACLSHLVLRFVLWRGGAMPWRYARFLDYCAERIFLRKVGGGYIFVHRLLLEYFALLEPGEIQRKPS